MAKRVKAKVTKQAQELPGAFELFKPSWQAIKLNAITFIELIVVPFMVSLIGLIFDHSRTVVGSRIAFQAIGDIVGLLLGPAVVVTQLASVRGKQIDFWPAVRKGLHFFWRYVLLGICMVVVIGIGFVLLIVPGFFMLRRYILAPYYLIDQDLKVLDAMKKSAEQSKQFSMAVWGLLGVELLFVALTFVLVGVVLTLMYYCAPALRYYQIKAAAKRA